MFVGSFSQGLSRRERIINFYRSVGFLFDMKLLLQQVKAPSKLKG